MSTCKHKSLVTFNGPFHTKVNRVIEEMELKCCGNVGVWIKMMMNKIKILKNIKL